MTTKLGTKVELAVEFPCPFCGKQAGATKGMAAVIHAMPYCPDFDRLDALAFITAARMAVQGGDDRLLS